MGYLVLQGGAEFGGGMEASDRRAIELAGGVQSPVHIIPAAAAPDNNHERAGGNGMDWFRRLGAQTVSLAPVIDHGSANDAGIAGLFKRNGLVYLLGGFPAYLARVLKGSLCWQAIRSGLDRDLVLAGSSAGAMVLCQYMYDPERKSIVEGLGLLSNCCILPHHNTFGRHWAAKLQKDLPLSTLVGIDEQTGMVNDGPKGEWTVHGPGRVTLYRCDQTMQYVSGEQFALV